MFCCDGNGCHGALVTVQPFLLIGLVREEFHSSTTLIVGSATVGRLLICYRPLGGDDKLSAADARVAVPLGQRDIPELGVGVGVLKRLKGSRSTTSHKKVHAAEGADCKQFTLAGCFSCVCVTALLGGLVEGS